MLGTYAAAAATALDNAATAFATVYIAAVATAAVNADDRLHFQCCSRRFIR